MTKNLITTIQVNLCFLLHVSLGFGTDPPVIKIFVISLPSQPFFGCHLRFFTMAFFRAAHFFTAWIKFNLQGAF